MTHVDDPVAVPGTRARILAAAARALSVKGYSKTHLADIAEFAELQPPAVYYYFSSREELISAVMREGQRMVREHVLARMALLPVDATPAARVAAAVEAHLRLELELSDFASAVTRNAGQLPASIRTELDVESEAFHDVWRGILAEAAADGSLRTGLDASIGRMLVIGALNWATDWWREDLVPLDTVIGTAQSLVDAALFGRD